MSVQKSVVDGTVESFLKVSSYPKCQTICSNTPFLHNCIYHYEKYRIESYKNWPIPWLNVRDLAANGFYYTGTGDTVQCRFCRIKICNWNAEDDPNEQHNLWAPYCPFVRGLETENVKLNKKN